jgi:hypothetical protein
MKSQLVKCVADNVRKADAPLGYLTDEHIKWIKGFIYYMLGSKNTNIYLNFNSTPRLMFVNPLDKNGKILNVYKWLRFKYKLYCTKDAKKPLLDPNKWSDSLDLKEWKITLCRVLPKGFEDLNKLE